MISDLARNEEFSEIAVINFFTVLKKTQLSVGGGSCEEKNEKDIRALSKTCVPIHCPLHDYRIKCNSH